jgi:predicted small lipoprotein YifL
MKYIYTVLFLMLIFTGCGYKGDPIYVDNASERTVK